MVEQNTPSVTPGEVSLKSSWLYVDGQKIGANVLHLPEGRSIVTPEALLGVLSDNRTKILDCIVNFNYPGASVEPSIFTVQLATEAQIEGKSKVLSEAGYANGGVLESMDELQRPFFQYWHSTMYAGFRPEARRMSGKAEGGLWLLLRRPTLLQVSEEWTNVWHRPLFKGFVDGMKARRFTGRPPAELAGLSKRQKSQILVDAANQQLAAIEAGSKKMADHNYSEDEYDYTRTSWEVGARLSFVALKQMMKLDQGIDDDIAVSLEQAREGGLVAVARAIENATYRQ